MLHSAFWEKTDELLHRLGEQPHQVKLEHRDDEIEKSVDAWDHVYELMMPTLGVPVSKAFLIELLHSLKNFERIQSEVPLTLVHGDFHMENCLFNDDGQLVITDWQSLSAGSCAEDIGYFIARAELYGNPLSRDETICLYLKSLSDNLGRPVSHEVIKLAIYAKILSVHIFWSPRYVPYYPGHVLHRVIESIHDSCRELELL